MSHLFYESSDGHSACGDCDVIVDPHLVDAVALECPVSPCTSPSNRGEPCVFIDGEVAPECSYCGVSGDPDRVADEGPEVTFR